VVQAVEVAPVQQRMYNLTVAEAHTFFVGDGQWLVHNCGEAKNFDEARRLAFEKAGLTNPEDVLFTKVDPVTGTVVEFKGPNGAKVSYDAPHSSPGAGHDMPHVGWQSAGKRGQGLSRGNITYNGPQHPYRSPIKGQGVVGPH